MGKSIIKNGLNKTFKKLGYQVTRIENANNLTLKKHTATLFEKFQIQCVIDIGACKGGYRNFLRNTVGYSGLIISFEPVKKNADILKNKYKNDPNWIIYNYALSDENATAEINITKSPDFSSFLEPDNSFVKNFKDVNTIIDTETVELKPLDSVIDSIKGDFSLNHTYLKIDTQGYDLKVLKGFRVSLPYIPALQTEVSLQHIYSGMPNFTDTFTYLKDASFDISGFFPIHLDSMQRVIEADCVMINSALNVEQ